MHSVLSEVAFAALISLALAACPRASEADIPPVKPHRWKPVADDVYLQESVRRIPTAEPVVSAAFDGSAPVVVVGGKLLTVSGEALTPVAGAPEGVTRLRALGDTLYAAAADGAFMKSGGKWVRIGTGAFVDFCLHAGRVHAATADKLFRLEGDRLVDATPEGGYLSDDVTVVMDDFSQVLADPVRIGPISRIASYGGVLYLLRGDGLALIEGRTLFRSVADWGTLPPGEVRDILSVGSRLFVATERGLGVLRGMTLYMVKGSDGLPYEDTTCLAEGFADDLWIGTTRGAIREVGNEYQYFGAGLWLPGERVHAVATTERTVVIATSGGVALITYEPYTLQKKAAHFERELEAWGCKRLGFTHSLWWSGEQDGWLREISDNDGGNSAAYLAAMAYKYAVTKDEAARKEAENTFDALKWLGDITGKPGFIARAIWSVEGDKGRRSTRGSGGLPAKWYPTADGKWMWKGDTSSDEVNGHMYAVSLYHDLVAKGKEKERAKEHLAAIAKHLLDNGWVLRDMDGKPTRWGRWDPDYLLKPYGYDARGLNGMEAQTYMITAHALTGDPIYKAGLEQTVKWRYHTFVVRQRLTFPPDLPAPWDDELAFRCYLPLLSYATDPELRSIYLRSLERSWELVRIQRLPFFNYLYGALTGNDCEEQQAAQMLRDVPLDVVSRSFANSHRADLSPPPGYMAFDGPTRGLSPRENGPDLGAGSPLRLDSGADGKHVRAPVEWLEAYWMGRYYGMIQAPTTKDRKALEPGPRATTQKGAAPYAGPPKPVRNDVRK